MERQHVQQVRAVAKEPTPTSPRAPAPAATAKRPASPANKQEAMYYSQLIEEDEPASSRGVAQSSNQANAPNTKDTPPPKSLI